MIFLRPWFLLALFVPFLIKKMAKKTNALNPWAKYIDKKLLKALTIKKPLLFTKNTFSKLAFLFWTVGVLGLSGPAWDKMPVPTTQTKTNTVIVMDLNSSLLPKQLQQKHIQFYDLLSLLKDNRVGLVVYGTTKGYTAMPLTPDIQLLENLIPSLIPSILPEDSTNPKAGIKEAEKILEQTGGKGRIIFIGEDKNISSKYPLLLLSEKTNLNDFAHTLSNQNVSQSVFEMGDKNADVWYDRGIWLALICLIPACLLFRKNLIYLWLIFVFSTNAEAGFFQREDQKEYALNQQGITAFQSKDYTKSEQLFKQGKNPYNQGNALAYQGKIQEAIQAYQEALKINPNDEDAKFNKEYLEKLIPPEQQQQQQQQQQQKDSQSEQDNKENQDQQETSSQQDNQQNTAQSKDNQEQNSEDKDNQNQSEQQSGQEQEAQPTQEETQKELEQALAEQETENQFNQEEQQILNRLNWDPARVLRYRINLQHHKG